MAGVLSDLPGSPLAEALERIEELALAAHDVTVDREMSAGEKALCLLDLAEEAQGVTFPEAARHAVWLAAGDWLYSEPQQCRCCDQALPHDFERDRELWMRQMWQDEARGG